MALLGLDVFCGMGCSSAAYECRHPEVSVLYRALETGRIHTLVTGPLELIEKLSVLIPAPRFHTLRFHGVLAPHASWRAQIIPKPGEAVEGEVGPAGLGIVAGAGSASAPASGSAGLSWAALLKRMFALDVLRCPSCGGRRRLVGVYTGGQRLRDLLA